MNLRLAARKLYTSSPVPVVQCVSPYWRVQPLSITQQTVHMTTVAFNMADCFNRSRRQCLLIRSDYNHLPWSLISVRYRTTLLSGHRIVSALCDNNRDASKGEFLTSMKFIVYLFLPGSPQMTSGIILVRAIDTRNLYSYRIATTSIWRLPFGD